MNNCARVTAKGQITIPKAIRSQMVLGRGDLVVFEPCEHGMSLRKALLSPVASLDQLTRELGDRIRQRGVTVADVEEAVRWSRSGI